MLLNLYKVGTNGRVQLGADLAKFGDFYTVATGHDDDGADTITLTKVQVNTTGGQRPGADGE